MKKKTILITGAAGFLGSHLAKLLTRHGHHVIGIDNLLTGYRSNIQSIENYANFKFIEHDVSNPIDLEVDEIFNLACPASPPKYQDDPVRTMTTSILGAINILNLAKGCGARVLQASTSEVYGDPELSPQNESYRGNVNPTGIRACYDEGKRAAETLFFDYHRQYGVEIKVMRIFNTYGPQMDPGDGRVVSNFIVQALKGEDITIYGDGSQTRSFCYVDDLVDGMVRLMNSPVDFTGPINIGNPNEFTVRELAHLVLEKIGSKSKLTYLPLPQDDPLQRCPDIKLAHERLGWFPKTHLNEGLDLTIAYFRNMLNAKS
jgi:UDP-glucuronate decarboxylase